MGFARTSVRRHTCPVVCHAQLHPNYTQKVLISRGGVVGAQLGLGAAAAVQKGLPRSMVLGGANSYVSGDAEGRCFVRAAAVVIALSVPLSACLTAAPVLGPRLSKPFRLLQDAHNP